METGFCVKADGGDQNSGVTKLDYINRNTLESQQECFKLCRSENGATGCEVSWDRKSPWLNGCSVHTQEIARGNGAITQKWGCWVFSKCEEEGRCIGEQKSLRQ